MSKKEDLKKQILELTREYYREVHAPPLQMNMSRTGQDHPALLFCIDIILY